MNSQTAPLAGRLPFGKLLLSNANKHTRQPWAMLRRGVDYDSEAWLHYSIMQWSRKKSIAA